VSEGLDSADAGDGGESLGGETVGRGEWGGLGSEGYETDIGLS